MLTALLGVLIVVGGGLWWCGFFHAPVKLIDAREDGSQSLLIVHRRPGFRIPAEHWGELRPQLLTRYWSAEWISYSPQGTPQETGWCRPFPVRSGSVTADTPPEGFIREGTWVGWHPDGTRAYQLTYWAGAKHGRLQGWHANGQLREVGVLKRDVRSGDWTTWHANGQRESQEHYVAGKLHGPRTTWHATGKLRSQHEFQHGRMVGEELVYDAEGQLSAKSSWVDGRENGVRLVINSERRIEQDVVDGKLHGKHREVDPQGRLLVEGQAQNDLPQGIWISYFPSGQKEWERRYVEGQLDGPEVRWHPSGGRLSEGAYRAGKRQGPWTEWDAAGRKRAEGEWHDGRRHGIWVFYEDGKPSRQTRYESGKVLETMLVSINDPPATVDNP